MINEAYIKTAIEKAKICKYSSINYIEYEDCKNAEILHDNDDLILWLDKTQKRPMLYFATNDFEQVISSIASIDGNLRLHFVPKLYMANLKSLGFLEWGEYQGFFSRDTVKIVEQFPCNEPPEFAKPNEAKEAMNVVKSCELQSRGFEGYPLSFYEEMAAQGKILINQKNNEIAGVCTVDIYDSGRPTLHIREIATAPAYQGRGIAKKLLSQAFEWGITHCASQAFLLADILNTGAIALYNKYGFVPDDDDTELQMIRE